MEIILTNKKFQAVVTTQGAELIELTDDEGKSYIWSGDSNYWSGRNPILFPIVGNLKNGQIKMDGQIYSMNRHGFARNREFSILEQGRNYIVFELRADEDTLKNYPVKFILQVRHSLEEDGFTTTFKIINKDSKKMPFCIGAHTAFNCPMSQDELFEDYEIMFDKEETAYNMILNDQGCLIGEASALMLNNETSISLNYETFAELDTLIFKGLTSSGVSLKHKVKGHGIHMDYQGFPMMAFWTKGKEKAPFICIEPWHGCAAFEYESGEFVDKEACILLEPEEMRELSYTVQIF